LKLQAVFAYITLTGWASQAVPVYMETFSYV